MKLIIGAAAAALIALGGVAHAEDAFEPSPVGPDVAAQLSYLSAKTIGTRRGVIGPSRVLRETIRRPLSFRNDPLLTLAESEALLGESEPGAGDADRSGAPQG